MSVRLGVDVGGTFTDAVLLDGQGRMHLAKVRSTPSDLAAGFLAALAEVCANGGVSPAAISYLVHGSTVATNAIVQNKAARVGLLTTRGFRDVIEIGTQQRPRLYDLRFPKPPPLVPRDLRLEASERVGPDGQELEPLNLSEVEAAARAFKKARVEAVAVGFLHAFANGRHEALAVECLARLLPGVPIASSSQTAPEIREYPRISTTALNAALLPLAGRYVADLAQRLQGAGARAPLHLMQSNGGVATAAAAARLPVGLVASGPAAGVIGAARVAAMVGDRDLLTFDMGGTTADVGLVVRGQPQFRFRGEALGHPLSLPQVDVLSVGAGGGSIARVDRFGSLQVGPQSAGADPGPAAYARGGSDATVTDAHIVLGTLDPQMFLGGSMALDSEAAHAAVRKNVGAPLSLGVEEAAAAVVRVANASMVRALRVISVARGHDPRRFSLVAFGGAGPLHACAIAGELGIRRIVVPRYPGVTSALGLLLADVQHDLRLSWVRPTAGIRIAQMNSQLETLERQARELLAGAGYADGRGRIEAAVDMRYRGQAYELTIPLRAARASSGVLASMEVDFHGAHRRAYGHDKPVQETEVVTLRMRAVGRVPTQLDVDGVTATGGKSRRASRRIWMGGRTVACPIHRRQSLREGARVRGPALIEQDDSTLLVEPGWVLRAASAGNVLLERL